MGEVTLPQSCCERRALCSLSLRCCRSSTSGAIAAVSMRDRGDRDIRSTRPLAGVESHRLGAVKLDISA
jgi:hypothetical protein